MRERIAARLARRLYRNPIIGDVPRSKLYFLVMYGTWAKLANYLRARRDFREMRTQVASSPYVIRAEPISGCNLRCPLCPTGTGEIDRESAAMSPETLDDILDRCGRHALYAVLWIWGEPLLNKRLADLVRVCRRRGIGTEVSSNLSLPLSEARIDELIGSGLDWLIVSNDAATAPTYAQYRIGGNFDLVLKNTRAFVARKRALGSATPFIEWQFVPLRHNENEMRDVERLAREIGVDGIRFKPARLDKTRGITFRGVVPDDTASKWAPRDPRLVHALTHDRKSFVDRHCAFLWVSVSVYGDGAIAPCCETTSRRDDLGNVFRQEFGDIWNGPAYVAARRVALGLAQGPGEEAMACHGCKVFRKPLTPAAAHPDIAP